ncbi:MAG: phosphomannomutase/phosphoglucomutase [Clostridia bacterium]|nr:phosphomannomutase/phosphoglucomutase [Clostridia bacterium]
MALYDFQKLRNGTDVRGIAVEGIEGEHVDLKATAVQRIASAFALWLKNRLGKDKVTIAVGHDSRVSAADLSKATIDGILQTGNDARFTALSTTPSMFMLLKDKTQDVCDGSVMITASHLPFNRNGMKFFTGFGGLEGTDVKEILSIAESDFPLAKEQGVCVVKPYLDEYASSLVEKVRKETGELTPLKGKKIVVDAGNGAGGFFVNKVLVPLGADTDGSQFLEPDGTFPNHIPNPENAEAMQSVCSAVKKANADFGIIFDTDVDRAGAVDEKGEEINRNRLIALISAILLSEKKGTIVTDSVTSDGLKTFIEEKGGRHHRFKRGYKNVINEAIRLNEQGEYTPLAIETSGHAALMENYFLDDGAYLITRLLIALSKAAKVGQSLTAQIESMQMPKEAKEVRLRFKQGVDFKTLGAGLIKDFEEKIKSLPYAKAAENNFEGFRANFDKEHGDGWILTRMSLHEPILPVNAESNSQGGVKLILTELYTFLQAYDFLDLSALEKALN